MFLQQVGTIICIYIWGDLDYPYRR